MDSSFLSGVSGLQAHQRMLDIAGNNLANVNTTAFKSSRVNFAELMSETLREASQPTGNSGGTNPMQIGSGVQISSIARNMSQGSLVNTGQPLDMAIDGEGYFVMKAGESELYTRAGAFAVDASYYLVDPSTGYRLQRNKEGMNDDLQIATNTDIRVPYNDALEAKATENLSYIGNLSADDVNPTTSLLITSGLRYTIDQALVGYEALLADLDQATGLAAGDKMVIGGTTRDGTAITETDFEIFDGSGNSKTIGDLIDAIQALYPDSTVSFSNGEIRVQDDEVGYSKTDTQLTFVSAADSEFVIPKYFTITSAGGEASKNTNVDIYDSLGIAHSMSAAFVKSNESNKWDLVVTSITGDVELVNRRISDITFLTDGSFASVGGTEKTFQFKFAGGDAQTIDLNFGLSQFGGASTVVPGMQDGYAAGWLSSVSVSREGVLVGVFTNGIRRDIAAIKLATFQNPAALTSVGNNYYIGSANSGDPSETKALMGSAGAVVGGSLEKSNVQMASEFVNLIEAQNGFQANARTIKVATDLVRELTGLIR